MIRMVGGKEVHITHIMADGRKLDSVEGYLTSIDQLPPLTQELLIQMFASQASRTVKETEVTNAPTRDT